ncbi:hypothetical protein NDU88_007164 [Pleurodeles waltl]|uniref:Uncharacterized protein n=1 Tax=Pleurodeles waltl TaxID=8319 RepID=A0AAV7RS80_PLEWA|nr:hypothetical protein NDU88_007164 [Pleurodeles waltl]
MLPGVKGSQQPFHLNELEMRQSSDASYAYPNWKSTDQQFIGATPHKLYFVEAKDNSIFLPKLASCSQKHAT